MHQFGVASEGRLFLHAGGNIGSSLTDTEEFLNGARRAVFLPYAVHDYDAYTTRMTKRFGSIGVTLTGLHSFDSPAVGIRGADAIVVGGGNSFRLIKTLHELGLIEPVRQAVQSGVPYWGSSAGSNVACPTIRTTNDMPIVEPPSLRAFALVPFQINPHYIDEPLKEGEVRETRETRIIEFLEENNVMVVGLREGSWIVATGEHSLRLRGPGGAVLFTRGRSRTELDPETDLSFLWRGPSLFDEPILPGPEALISP